MTIYFIFFLLPLLIFLSEIFNKKIVKFIIKLYLILLCIFIGFRHGVGGDFYSYSLNLPNKLSILGDLNLLNHILSVISSLSNFDIYLYNFICSLLICFSLYKLSKLFEFKSQIFIISFPILIIIVAMGFTKQSASAAFLILSITYFIREKKFLSFFMMFIGSLFHIALIPFFIIYLKVIINNFKKNIYLFLTLIFLLIVFVIIYYELFQNYIFAYLIDDSKPTSQGALVRIFISLYTSLIYIYFRKQIINYNKNYYILDYFVFYSFLFFIILMFSNFATLVDRLNLYLVIFQVILYSVIVELNKKHFILIFFYIFLIYGLILITWFLFANHSFAWIPYGNILFKF